MTCTPIEIESAQFVDCDEARESGLTDLATVWLPDDIETWPAWFSTPGTTGTPPSKMEAKTLVDGEITMKASKKPFKLPCILEKNGYETKQVGNSWETEVKITVQNTPHNRGFVDSLIGRRFLLGIKEVDGDTLLVGRTDGLSTGYLATIKKDSAKFISGDAPGSDRMGEFIVIAKRYLPTVYTGTITY